MMTKLQMFCPFNAPNRQNEVRAFKLQKSSSATFHMFIMIYAHSDEVRLLATPRHVESLVSFAIL